MGRSQLLDTDSQQDIMLSAGALYFLCLYGFHLSALVSSTSQRHTS